MMPFLLDYADDICVLSHRFMNFALEAKIERRSDRTSHSFYLYLN